MSLAWRDAPFWFNVVIKLVNVAVMPATAVAPAAVVGTTVVMTTGPLVPWGVVSVVLTATVLADGVMVEFVLAPALLPLPVTTTVIIPLLTVIDAWSSTKSTPAPFALNGVDMGLKLAVPTPARWSQP